MPDHDHASRGKHGERPGVDVFVSYASDDRPLVRSMVEALEASGLAVWWDRSIGTGSAFDREIESALDSARCVLVLWSPSSIKSDWVRAEAYEGLNRGVLVPVTHDGARPPLAFRQTQSIQLSAGHEKLIEAVRTLAPAQATVRDADVRIRYTKTTDDVKLAYITQGAGTPLVRCLSWITSCSLELSDRNTLTSELSRDFRLLTYDGRGCGLSQRGIFDWTAEQRLLDLETVITASGIDEPFALFGISEGARTAIAFAAKYPEKVTHMVLHGPAMPSRKPDPAFVEGSRWFVDFICTHWGTTLPIARRMVCAIWSSTSSEEEQIYYMQQMRESMTAEAAGAYLAAIIRQNNEPAASDAIWQQASEIGTPTLIVHSIRDPMVPYEGAQDLASVMPHAELLPLAIADHGTGLSRELDQIQATETRRFILENPV